MRPTPAALVVVGILAILPAAAQATKDGPFRRCVAENLVRYRAPETVVLGEQPDLRESCRAALAALGPEALVQRAPRGPLPGDGSAPARLPTSALALSAGALALVAASGGMRLWRRRS